jgi:hexosaminidase
MKNLLSTIGLLLICGIMFAQTPYNLIPLPVEVIPGQGTFVISSKTVIAADKSAKASALYLQQLLEQSTGFQLNVVSATLPGSIVLAIDPSLNLPAEGYTLSTTGDRVSIQGKDADGLFYGIQTLLQLMPAQVYARQIQRQIKWTVPAVAIKDYPRFHYRGMMLDVSRQFFDVSVVKRYIDWLSMHKINRFHWHLTDDQGWRIEIKKYPKLTSVGAWRGPGEALPPSYGSGDKRYGGYYSQQQIKEIVRYATARHIEIIPEIDLPGHSRAVGVAYPEILCPTDKVDMNQSAQEEVQNVWCAGNEKNFKMIENILKEVVVLFPSKVIHIGGDEVNMSVWQHCPLCSSFMKKEGMQEPEELQNYFVRRLEKMVHRLGKQMAGWDEIIDGGTLDSTTEVYAWRSVQRGVESVKKGLPTVMMVGQNYYFDMAQSKYDRGHNWAGILPLDKVYALDPADLNCFTSAQASLIQGVQGAIWSELLNEPDRFLEYQSYPRVCALAEAGWTPQGDRNWNDFYARLTGFHFDRMCYMGIAFRLPPPIALYKDGTVTVTLPYPDAEVRYTNDGSEPSPSSALYRQSIREFDYPRLKFKTFYKQLSSISILPECDTAGIWNTDGNTKPEAQTWPLSSVVDRAGIWYITFDPRKNSKEVASISQVRLYENNVIVASDERPSTTDRPVRYRLPLLAFDKTKTYTLKAFIKSDDALAGNVKVERSPYLEPATGISVNMNLSTDNAKALTDYDFDSFVRTRDHGKAGQSLTFAFDSPLICSRVTAITGMPFTGIYSLKSGHLEISYDGVTFIRDADFINGKAIAQPSRPIKAVRIVVDVPNDDTMIVFQDLRIEPAL